MGRVMKPLKAGMTEKQSTAGVLDAAAIFGLKLERQNTGMATGASGKPVRFGTPGNPDFTATVHSGPNRGRTLAVEIKRGDFDPAKARGEKRAHFDRQLAAMKRINDSGGLAFWVRCPKDAAKVFQWVMTLQNMRVVFDEVGFGTVTDEPEQGRATG